ncbi:hypothetical protein RJJ65_32860 [Rhizobium hidalgonense]|uniref:Uncharacterized protein n=1 Tax=Rhizobium hidalgonense TaxID=1538159 RepID=A0AAJ2LPU2_9HYPH|nr:hypothetical protein [Rhizobium hidalgonense]MDR9777348.1 hypothetical protein [Rhizobium hidalgonense]MDR9814964.1 hypothetical protein [Rhizobium hidalgonense]MDR9823608.1 hypothetical protein [Rhizobium hidalgonense]
MTIEILGQWADALITAVDLRTVFLASLVRSSSPFCRRTFCFPQLAPELQQAWIWSGDA